MRISGSIILTAGGTLCHPLLPAGVLSLDAAVEFSLSLGWGKGKVGACSCPFTGRKQSAHLPADLISVAFGNIAKFLKPLSHVGVGRAVGNLIAGYLGQTSDFFVDK